MQPKPSKFVLLLAISLLVPWNVHGRPSGEVDDLERRLQQLRAREAARREAEETRRQQEHEAAERARQEEQEFLAWVSRAEARVYSEPTAVASEAAALRDRHPDSVELARLLDKAVERQLQNLPVDSPDAARSALLGLEPLLVLAPGNANVQLSAGKGRHMLSEYEKASEHYQRALTALPSDAPNRLAVLQWYQQAKSRKPYVDVAAANRAAEQLERAGGFVESSSGMLRDTKSGLTWTQTNRVEVNYRTAVSHCASLGMRLPTLDEFKAIHGRGQTPCNYPASKQENTCLVSPLFKLTLWWYWSASPSQKPEYDRRSDAVWVIGLHSGSSIESSTADIHTSGALCVR